MSNRLQTFEWRYHKLGLGAWSQQPTSSHNQPGGLCSGGRGKQGEEWGKRQQRRGGVRTQQQQGHSARYCDGE